MPEIVEVRVVKNVLKKQILNKKIKNIKVLYPKMIEGDINILKGKSFNDITTFGKWIIFNLGDYSLLSHLRMEGKYFYEESFKQVEKHTHVIFKLDNGYDLRYNDTRKFGKMVIIKSKDVKNYPALQKLGLEPDDKSLNEKYLLQKLKNKKKCIKDLLLDQTIINGLGNIYANEVLFASKINPLKRGCDITKKEASSIIESSRKIIEESTKLGGCTIKSYTSSLGVEGKFQEKLLVHKKENKPCYICNTKIKRIKISGRSTYYCENCQKEQ